MRVIPIIVAIAYAVAYSDYMLDRSETKREALAAAMNGILWLVSLAYVLYFL